MELIDEKINNVLLRASTKETHDILGDPPCFSDTCKSNERYIRSLEKQVKFLQTELSSKTKIIELLIEEKHEFTKNNISKETDSHLEKPKKTSKMTVQKDSPLTMDNRYDVFFLEDKENNSPNEDNQNEGLLHPNISTRSRKKNRPHNTQTRKEKTKRFVTTILRL